MTRGSDIEAVPGNVGPVVHALVAAVYTMEVFG